MADGQMKVSGGVLLRPIDLVTMNVRLIGESPLIVHRFDEKAKRQMLEKHMKKAPRAKEAKDPVAIAEAAQYRMSDGRHGFPVVAFKAAAVRACTSVGGLKMTEARQAFLITGEHSEKGGAFEGSISSTELTQLFAPPPRIREDMVRVTGTTDIRYRAEYWPWAVELKVTFNAGFVSAEQLLDVFKVAGFAVGVGEWRPEKNGSNGRFRIATKDDDAAFAALSGADKPKRRVKK